MLLNPDTQNMIQKLNQEIVACRRCPRLVAWREGVALTPPRRFLGEGYWARPLPGFGDASARLFVIGLAPAAHGGNRTGRVFTGDRSGDWLFRALWKAGFANQPASVHIDDGLQLLNCYIAAACRCAPPDNKPLPQELANCRPYLLRELNWFFGDENEKVRPNSGVLLGLGKIGFDAAFDAARAVGLTEIKTRPKFGHSAEVRLNEKLTLMGTYHPSQQNTFTGRLTEPMLDAVFTRINEILQET